MDTDEINRQIHTFLGECLGKSFSKRHVDLVGDVHICDQCGGRVSIHSSPDYCSDLNLVRAAEERVIEMVGEAGYAALVMQETSIRATGQNWTSAVTASAKERCLAILRAGRAE